MRIAICEDSPHDAQQLQIMLNEYFDNNAQVTIFRSGLEFLMVFEQSPLFDFVFLDITMPGIDGMEVAKVLRQHDDRLPIVFVTYTMEYAVEGYTIGVFRYLLKPVDKNEFNKTLTDIMERRKLDGKTLILNLNGETFRILIDSIMYIEKVGKKTVFYIDDGKEYAVRLPILNILKCMDTYYVISPHQSYIVNLKYVSKISKKEKSLLLLNGCTLPIARARINETYSSYMTFVGGMNE